MAGKISDLAALTAANVALTDLMEILDISDTSMAATGTNKQFSMTDMVNFLLANRISIVTYTGTAITAVIGDGNRYVRFTGTTPTYTIPPNSSVAFAIGTQIDGIGVAGAMTIVAGGGVTIVKARTLVTTGAGSGWTLIKVATDSWDLHGDFV